MSSIEHKMTSEIKNKDIKHPRDFRRARLHMLTFARSDRMHVNPKIFRKALSHYHEVSARESLDLANPHLPVKL